MVCARIVGSTLAGIKGNSSVAASLATAISRPTRLIPY
jgi:hypothetical protein